MRKKNSASVFERATQYWRTKLLIALIFLIIIISEQVISASPSMTTTELIDVGFVISTKLNHSITPDEMYWFRFALLGIQTIFIIGILLIMTIRILFYSRFKLAAEAIIMYTTRILSMLTFILPNHKELLWHFPGVPNTVNDFFYSGHIAITIIVAKEIHKMGYKKVAWWLGIAFNLYQIFVFLVTRSHYTCDCITAIFAGIAITAVSELYYPDTHLNDYKKND